MRYVAILLILALALPAIAQEGEWTELRPLEDERVEEQKPVETPRSLRDLPRRFVSQGKVKTLAGVGYVYLGDYYLIDELDPVMAALAWRHAAGLVGIPAFLRERLTLLHIYEGDWPRAAAAFTTDLSVGLPPFQQMDWKLGADIPLTSDSAANLPAPPTILFRLALEVLRQEPAQKSEAPARHFLEGRLLTMAGMDTAAMRAFLKVPTDPVVDPWTDQAAAMRGHLLYRTFNPERALAEYSAIGNKDESLKFLLTEIRAGLDTGVKRVQGPMIEESLRIIGRNVEGRWVLESPKRPLGMISEVVGPDERVIQGRINYRGEDFWVLTLPLGTQVGAWERGQSVTLRAFPPPAEK